MPGAHALRPSCYDRRDVDRGACKQACGNGGNQRGDGHASRPLEREVISAPVRVANFRGGCRDGSGEFEIKSDGCGSNARYQLRREALSAGCRCWVACSTTSLARSRNAETRAGSRQLLHELMEISMYDVDTLTVRLMGPVHRPDDISRKTDLL